MHALDRKFPNLVELGLRYALDQQQFLVSVVSEMTWVGSSIKTCLCVRHHQTQNCCNAGSLEFGDIRNAWQVED